ncbi:YSC84-related protein [Marinobacteraceae bacterium S3BR75-40.1]
MQRRLPTIAAACAFCLVTGAPTVLAAQQTMNSQQTQQSQMRTQSPEDAGDAKKEIDEAARVVETMKQQPELKQVLSKAQGVFVIPDYATAALLVGAKGGQGVLLKQRQQHWSNPAFYNIGGLSFGAQAGGEAGAMAMLLMSDKAVETFTQSNNFSLNANAGLSIINWSADAQNNWGKGDVVVWSETEGAMAEASIGVSDIVWDDEANQAYYQQPTSPKAVLTGQVKNPHQDQLQNQLSGQQRGMNRPQQEAVSQIRKDFDRLDKNGDGKLSREELSAFGATAAGNQGQGSKTRPHPSMQQLDKNGDDAVTEDELQ